MLFNSFHFLFFFLVATILYYTIPYHKRWILLLISSCYFYMAAVPIYILVLGFTISIDYITAIFMESAKGRRRKFFLVISLVTNIGILCIFKYYNFLNSNLSFLLKGFALSNPLPYLKFLLPIGLSFHTFQAMSYIIEIYRGNQKAERHFGIYALYVMFYPQLVAGPIERPQNLIHQFRVKFDYEKSRVAEGLRIMLWGFFKKIVIADRLALYVNNAYDHVYQQSGSTLILATLFFSFQIYCDFSGYSDIAIGAAKIMGFNLMGNFNRPILAKSTGEFWKRWHISLSTWFKDYLYLPMGGNKVKVSRWYFNLMIVFLISGLWHGANWTFIIWGAINGFYVVFAIATKKYRKKLNDFIGITKLPRLFIFHQILITFLLISMSRVFFRARTAEEGFLIVKKMFMDRGAVFVESDPSSIIFSFIGIFILLFVELKREYYKGKYTLFTHKNILIRNFSYAILIIIMLLIGVFDGGQFIYFQF